MVHCVVGRFLEHSRIFYFEHAEPQYSVGSADWMTRNVDRRVEAITPVSDPALQRELRGILDTMLADNRRRWVMNADGGYDRQHPMDGAAIRDTHSILMRRATRAADDGEDRVDHERFDDR